jgi:hypothetical protein
MKETALQWLINQLDNNQDKTRQQLDYFVEKAKEMEKQQIIEACIFGRVYEYNKHTGVINTISNPEQYYNETYKK